jgi:hypothetical protein
MRFFRLIAHNFVVIKSLPPKAGPWESAAETFLIACFRLMAHNVLAMKSTVSFFY